MTMPVFCRINGKLAHFKVETTDPAAAINAVRHALHQDRTKPDGAVLATIQGGKA